MTTGWGVFDSASATKVTAFTAQAPEATDWCNNDALGAITETCCTAAKSNTIAIQFGAKYIFGVYNLVGLSLASPFIAKASDITANCVFKTLTATEAQTMAKDVAAKANRSMTGMYYAAWKIMNATQPYSQTMSCLVCANDATVATYVDASNNLKVGQTAFDGTVNGVGSGLFDLNNALKSMIATYKEIYTSLLIDTTASKANCTTIISSAVDAISLCGSAADCTALIKTAFTNTGLEYENILVELSKKLTFIKVGRELSPRSLATTAVATGGAGLSKYDGIATKAAVAGMTPTQLAANYAAIMLLSLSALLALL